MSEQIRREFTLTYPIDKVKTAIVDTCRTSVGSYQIKDRNDVFNSFSIHLVKMLSVLSVTIQLKKVSDMETHIELSAVVGPQLSKTPTFVAQMIDAFLAKVGDFVSGKLIVEVPNITNSEVPKPSQSRSIVAYVVIIAIIATVIYLVTR